MAPLALRTRAYPPTAPTSSALLERQSNNNPENTSLSGGAIAGIIIGSVLAVLLIIYLLRLSSAFQFSGDPPKSRRQSRGYYYPQETPHRPRSRGRRSMESRTSTSSRMVPSPGRVYVVKPGYSKKRSSRSPYV